MEEKQDNKEEVKESFCGACIAIPAALAGAGLSSASGKVGVSKVRRQIMLYLGVGISVISIMVFLYYYMTRCKKCGY